MEKREIKFRAWDLQELHYNVVPTGSREVMDIKKPYLYRKAESVMQYTGLKDKNGVEIYEGDILSNGDGSSKCLVVWRKDLASFALSKEGWMYDHYFGEAVDPGYCEVLGNIHQTPDLV